MAKGEKLTCLEKRDLLNQSAVSIQTLFQWGQVYQESGLLNEAVDFYEKTNAKEPLSGLLKIVLEDGDVFLFKRICRILGYEPDAAEWLPLAKKAEEGGKFAFAAEAFRLAGKEDAAGRSTSASDAS
jgi:tetratricopeptide (TPR) repeat protein